MSRNPAKKRILVVDDEPDIVTYLVALLRDNGYDPVSAQNGREGLEIIHSEAPDLVTLDISMPGGSGTGVYKQLKSDPQLARIPVIIVTAVTEDGADPNAFEDSILARQNVPAPEGYFTKPIDVEEFLSAVGKLLA
jgi:CheY-like chemotaxis protein